MYLALREFSQRYPNLMQSNNEDIFLLFFEGFMGRFLKSYIDLFELTFVCIVFHFHEKYLQF